MPIQPERRQYDILTFADTNVDLIMSGGDIVPRFGQIEQLVGDYALEMGGSCCIFACQAAKLGLRVGVLGRVGADSFGQLVLHTLAEAGVDIQHILIDPTLKTGLSVALTNAHDRAILTYLGTISALTPADVTDQLLASARHLHHGSFFLHTGLRPAMPQIFARARALGLTTSLDTNWDPDDAWTAPLPETLALTDVCMPNEQEALRMTGSATLERAIALLRTRAPLLALKRGADGAAAYTSTAEYRAAAQPLAAGGDSIGAGDSFDAGFLAGWLRGLPLADCLAIGSFCGWSVAGAVGGLRGQPGWVAVLERLEMREELRVKS